MLLPKPGPLPQTSQLAATGHSKDFRCTYDEKPERAPGNRSSIQRPLPYNETTVTSPPHRREGFSLDSKEFHDGQALTAAETDAQRTTPFRDSGTQEALPSPAESGDTHARFGMVRGPPHQVATRARRPRPRSAARIPSPAAVPVPGVPGGPVALARRSGRACLVPAVPPGAGAGPRGDRRDQRLSGRGRRHRHQHVSDGGVRGP